ncbi:MAG: hypothetical protein WB239_03190 [Acidimicrobiia bacterium]
MLNTGRVGGADDDDRSKKVRIPDTAAIVGGTVDGSIEWDLDSDFGYQVATSVPGIDDVDLLQPRRLYGRQSRRGEYEDMVERLRQERTRYLASYPALDPRVASGL